jgi:hypothetical protein
MMKAVTAKEFVLEDRSLTFSAFSRASTKRVSVCSYISTRLDTTTCATA